MAVLAEALSVVARSDRIRKRYESGDKTFVTEVPNASFCFDGELTRMGFMHPDDVSAYTRLLNERGLNLGHEIGPADFVVVDQVRGPLDQCGWLKFFRIRKEAFSVSACSLVGGSVTGLAVPDGWEHEGSISQEFGWMRVDTPRTRSQFIRRTGQTDVYHDELSGKEIYCARYGTNVD